MRIDAHQHFWQYDAATHAWITDEMRVIQRDFLPADLQPLLEAHGFDGCMAVQAEQQVAETHWLLALAAQHAFIKGVIGWVDLKAPDIQDQLLSFSGFPQLKGFRHVVQAEPAGFLLDSDFNRGIACLKDFSFIYEILVYEHQLAEVVLFVQQHPNQVFVLDHIGKPNLRLSEPSTNWFTQLEKLAAFPNVHVKISGLITEAVWNQWTASQFRPYLDFVLQQFGPQRILYGSDWPVCLLAGTYEEVVQVVQEWVASFGDNHMADLFWGMNAARLYRL
jgi:L-fuconolactonase